MTSKVDNIGNLNVRVSIVEDIQPGTKFAKVIFACFFCFMFVQTKPGQSPARLRGITVVTNKTHRHFS